MAYRDLREWITQVNELGELKTVEGADWDLEIGAIIEMARKSRRSLRASCSTRSRASPRV